GVHTNVQSVEDLQGLVGEPLRERWQDAVSGLDQVDRDVLIWIDSIEPIAGKLARCAAQLGRELGSGRAGADDGHVYLLGFGLVGLPLATHEGTEQQLMEALGVVHAVQQDRVLANAWSTEVVAMAADRDDQSVVVEETPPH